MQNVAAETALTPAPVTRVLREHVARWLHDKLVGIVRRAGKHGLACDLAVKVGDAWTEWSFIFSSTNAYGHPDDCALCAEARAEGLTGCARHYQAELMAEITITGGLPTIGGFTFLGALDFEGGEILVRTAPGQAVPGHYYAPGCKPTCDHCNVNRARKTVFVLADAEGKTVQVGAQCLAEYVRSADAERCADLLASMYSALDAATGEEDEDMGRYRTTDPRTSLVTWVSAAVCAVRHCKRYVSKAQAERTRTEGTSSIINTLIRGTEREMQSLRRAYGDIKVQPCDIALAKRAIDWARESFPADAKLSEFEHNMGVIARTGYTTAKTEGTAGYIAEAYKRTLAPTVKPPAARHLAAEVGKRVVFDAEVIRISSYDNDWGTTFITIMRKLTSGTVSGEVLAPADDDGAIVVWKSKDCPSVRAPFGNTGTEEWGKGGWVAAANGARITVRATVKEHSAYKGAPQTIITRCERVCDGWSYPAEAGSPEAELSARMISEGKNRPAPKIKARKPRVRKPKAAPVAEYVPATPAEPTIEAPRNSDETEGPGQPGEVPTCIDMDNGW